MTAFGVRAIDFGKSDEFYMGEDEVLWDWLLADNYETYSGNLFLVAAPAGYAFHQGYLFPVEDYNGGKRVEVIHLSSLPSAKVQMLLVSLRSVSPDDFHALKIDADRLITYFVH